MVKIKHKKKSEGWVDSADRGWFLIEILMLLIGIVLGIKAHIMAGIIIISIVAVAVAVLVFFLLKRTTDNI